MGFTGVIALLIRVKKLHLQICAGAHFAEKVFQATFRDEIGKMLHEKSSERNKLKSKMLF